MSRKRRFLGVVLVGFMGSGKTSVGREIARRTGAAFEDVDRRIEEAAGMSVGEIFASRGEAAFRVMERRAIREALAASGKVIATGGGAFLDEENRKALKAYATVVFLDVSRDAAAARLSEDRSRPLLGGGSAGLSGPERSRRIEELMRLRRPAYEQADHTIATDARTVGEVAERVLALLPSGGRDRKPARSAGGGGGDRG